MTSCRQAKISVCGDKYQQPISLWTYGQANPRVDAAAQLNLLHRKSEPSLLYNFQSRVIAMRHLRTA